MKLHIQDDDRNDAILICDEDMNDIAEFYHNEHAGVEQSYETALALANKLVAPSPLDAVWEAVNALGGKGNTSEELAFIYGIERALDVIEKLGGKNPLLPQN